MRHRREPTCSERHETQHERSCLHAKFLALIAVVALSAFAIFPSSASATEVQSLDSIAKAARQYLVQATALPGHTVGAEIAPLDPRLRLPACPQALQSFSPPGGRVVGNVTVGVRCEGAKPWTVYVQAQVQLVGPVVVVTRSVPKGRALTGADVRLERRDISNLSDVLRAPADAVGQIAKRALEPGKILSAQVLETPRLVRRGDRVTLLAGSAGFEIRMVGEALADGVLGASIRVRNVASKKIVQGTVAGAGVVRVAL